MKTWKQYKEDYILMVECGFIAVNQADEDAALKLFRAAALLDPENYLPKIGFGYLHLHKMELKAAIKIFEDVLAAEPKNEMARAFLGLCLGLQPASADKGEKILEETCKSRDNTIQSMSKTAIDFIEHFVKKTPGPASRPLGK